MNQQKNEIKFKFLPEKPLSDSNSALFGHAEIVSTLKRIIKNSPENNSLTVGLFGDWGSGKSTIVESLQKELSKEEEPIPVVIFDVWKHEGDALRRSFLTQLVNDLKDKFIDKNYKLNNRLTSSNKDSRITASSTLKLDWKAVFKKITSFFISKILLPLVDFIFIISALIILLYHNNFEVYENIKSFLIQTIHNLKPSIFVVISFLGSSAIVVFILERFLNLSTITSNKITEVNHEKFEDPNEFEEEFKKILKNLKTRKISIVFDNLDRVKGDKATTIISTIKTFLEPVDREVDNKEIIFIIPCDDKAIKQHLINELANETSNEHYADEYLRKFFNTSIRIPSFNTIELEGYAWDCLKKTEIKDLIDQKIAFLITQAFNDNPRQIVQFINTLITNYLVLWEREQNGSLGSKDFLSKNTPQLAKFLLLEQKFPLIMENLRKKNIYELKNLELNSNKTIKPDDPSVNDFNIFLKFTENIAIENLEIFFKLRISDHEKKLPNSSKLLSILETKSIKTIFESDEKDIDNFTEVREFIRGLNLKDNSDVISKIILIKLEDKRHNIHNFNLFLNNVLYLKKFCSIQFTQEIYEKINSVYNQSISIPHIDLVAPNILREEFIECHKTHLKETITKIINEWALMLINQIDDDANTTIFRKEFNKEIMENLISYPEKIKKEYHPKIATYFKDNYLVNFDYEIAKLTTLNDKIQPIIYNEDIISGLISLFDDRDINNFEKSRISVYLKLNKKLVSQVVLNQFINKMNQFLASLTTSPKKPEESYFKNVMGILNEGISKFNKAINFEESNLKTVLNEHLRRIESVSHIKGEDRRALIFYLTTLEKLETPIKSKITSKLSSLINDTDVKDLELIFKNIEEPSEFLNESKFDPALKQRLISNEPFFNVIYEFSSNEMKAYHLINSIENKKYAFFWNIVKKHKYDIPKKKEISDKILQETKSASRNMINMEHQKSFYEIIEGLNLTDEEINTKEYLEQIEALLNQNEQNKFKIGLNTLIKSKYFTNDLKTDYLKTCLNLFFSKIQSDNWKIKEVIINGGNIVSQSDYDNLIKENIINLTQDLLNTKTTDVYREISTVVSISTKKVLINKFLKKLISEFNPPRPQQPIRFKESLTIVLHESSLKDVYFDVKENLILLLNTLLIPTVEKDIQGLIIKNISAMRSFSKSIPKEIQEKIDDLFYHKSTPIDFKLSLEDYLSKEAIENRLKIISAKYGSENDIIDLTEKLNGLVKVSTLEVRVDNMLAGKDPAVGKHKVLNLEYKFKGVIHTKRFNESHNLRIP